MPTSPVLPGTPASAGLNLDEFAERVRSKYPGMYDDLTNQQLTERTVAKYPQYADMLAPQFRPRAVAERHARAAAPPREADPGFLARLSQQTLGTQHPIDELKREIPYYWRRPDELIKDTGKTALGMASGLGQIILHPVQATGGDVFAEDVAAKNYRGATGTLLGAVGPFLLSPESRAVLARAGERVGTLAKAASAPLREAAMAHPDEAVLRALNVTPGSKGAGRMLATAKIARPFLKGVERDVELQGRLPVAKETAWAPYKDAIERIGDREVDGPEGKTTVAQLEQRRRELSAINRAIRSRDPAATQLAMQKGLSQADLLRQENEVKAALDSQLRAAGINPVLIRRVYGALSRIEEKVGGRIAEHEKSPMGFGKMLRGTRVGAGVGQSGQLEGHGSFLTMPIVNIGAGLRDILAGRGLWSGSPIDIGVREGFRVAGPKPNFMLPPPSGFRPSGFRPAEEKFQFGTGSPSLVERHLIQRRLLAESPVRGLLPERTAIELGAVPTEPSFVRGVPAEFAQRDIRGLLPERTAIELGPSSGPSGPSFVRGVEAERGVGRGKGGRFKRVYLSGHRGSH